MNGRTAARVAPIDGSTALKMEASGSETRRPRRAEAPRRPRGPQTAHAAARRQAEPEPQQRRRIAPTFLIGVLAVAAVVSGHVDKWLDIRKLEAEKKRSADGGASTDQSNIRKEFFL